MSGGERQRLAMAGALVNDPPLILADEPTGDLDSQRGSQILHLLASIAHERESAVLMVTHDPQAAGVADRVYGLRDGKLDEVPMKRPSTLPPAELTPGVS
jgi:putative ABC transport system ATP-binding protein